MEEVLLLHEEEARKFQKNWTFCIDVASNHWIQMLEICCARIFF